MKAKLSITVVIGLAAGLGMSSTSRAQLISQGPRLMASSSTVVEKFTKLTINGNGSTNLNSTNCPAAGLVCPSGDTCECVETNGNYKGNIVGSGTFHLIIDLDATTSLHQGSGLDSFGAAGFITLTSGSNSLVMETNGLIANAPLMDFAEYTGSYGVSSGTGKFATTIGTGTVALNAANLSPTGDTQISLVGNIDQKP